MLDKDYRLSLVEEEELAEEIEEEAPAAADPLAEVEGDEEEKPAEE